MLSKSEFDYMYDEMTIGQKQHMANRLYKRDEIVPQQVWGQIPSTYKIGDKFTLEVSVNNRGKVYMLARAGDNHVSLINLETGNRWSDGVEVKNYSKITEKEFVRITAEQPEKFRKVK